MELLLLKLNKSFFLLSQERMGNINDDDNNATHHHNHNHMSYNIYCIWMKILLLELTIGFLFSHYQQGYESVKLGLCWVYTYINNIFTGREINLCTFFSPPFLTSLFCLY